MTDANERMQILEMIENGRISAEQGMKLLEALGSDFDEEIDEDADDYDQDEELLESGEEINADPLPEYSERVSRSASLPPGANRWRSFWKIPLWVGVIVTVLSGYWMYRAQIATSVGWFICASLPFLIGVLLLALAWQARTGPWLHLRVQQKEGESPRRIALSFPLPIRPAAWFLRTFGNRIKGLEDTAVDELILAMGESTSPDNPLYIQVDEGDGEEKVEVYIG